MTILSEIELRVLGSLIEKELTTPQYYPLTLNALTNACNQKSNRHPVVAYADDDVIEALDLLRRKNLAGETTGAGSRVTKYRHLAPKTLELDGQELAILCELMLRGPQTPGELRTRASRMTEFESLEEVTTLLDGLTRREPEPYVKPLDRRPGQKERRYAQLLGGDVADDISEDEEAPARPGGTAVLADEVARLRTELDALRAEFDEWKRQFE